MKRSRIVLTSSLFVLVLSASAAFAAGPVDEALAAFKAGEFAKAATLAAKVPEGDAMRSKALYLLGESELARGRFAEASAAFEGVLKAKKDNVPALTGLGRAQCANGQREAAKKTLKRAIELDAKDVPARRALGETLLADGDADAAVKELEAASKLDPKDALTARAFVEALLRKGSIDGASKAATAFSAATPESAMAWFLKGLVLDRKGEAKDAIDAYEKVLKADERFLDAHRNLAVLCTTSNADYANPKLIESAVVHARRYIELGGTDVRLKELLEQIQGFMDEMRGGGGK